MNDPVQIERCSVSAARPGWGIFSLLSVAMGALLLVPTLFPSAQLAMRAAFLLLGGACVALGFKGKSLRLASKQLARDATVVADERGLSVDGRLVLPHEEVGSALVTPDASGAAQVRIKFRHGAGWIDVSVRSVDEGRALIDGLGVGARAKSATIIVNGQRRRFGMLWMPLISLLVAGDAGRIHPVFGVVVFAAMLVLSGYLAFRALAEPRKIEIGVDALVLHAVRGPSRPIALHRVQDVRTGREAPAPRGKAPPAEYVVLTLTDDIEETIRVGPHEAEVVAERIREAMRVRDEATPAAASAKVLERGQREVKEWLSALRALISTPVDAYRGVIDAPTLMRIVEDPSAPAETRAAAAVALGPSMDDDQKARIRVAAETSATPKLRVALTAATDDDDRAVIESLEALRASE